MPDLASLGIKVTTDGVQQAQSDLDKLAASGDKAATSTDKLAKSSANASKAYDGATYRQQTADLAKLAGQIDPTVAKLDQLDKQQAKLTQFRKSGMISADDFTSLSGAIDAARNKIAGVSDETAHFTLNNANARRELGLLAKDVATGQWGRLSQSFTTLLGQSGALGALFSGIGVAVIGATAEVGTFVLAANSASETTNKFNAALAQTGDNIGISAEGMSKFASQVAGNNANIGKANDVLIALAKNGKVTGETFLSLGQAALDMSRLTGESADDAAKSVTKMFDGTASSAAKANEQYHFLTLELYEQIDALEKEGDAQGAVLVAANAFHDAVSPHLEDMKDKVTGIAGAWDAVKTSFQNFAQTFKNGAALIAGTADIQTQIYALQGKKEAASTGDYNGFGTTLNTFLGAGLVDKIPGAKQSFSTDDQAELDRLQKQLADANAKSDKNAQDQQIQQTGVTGQSLLDKYTKQYETDEQKREDALISIHNAANKAIGAALAKGDTDLVNKIMAQEAEADANARASFAKKPRTKADPLESLNNLTAKAITQDSLPTGDDTAQNKLLKDQVNQLQAIAEAGAKAIEKGADLAKVQAEVGTAVAATNDYFSKQADILTQKDVAAMAAYTAALDKQNDALQRQMDAQVAQVSMGDKEYAQQQKINDLYVKSADTIQKLQAQRSAPGANTSLIDQQIAAVEANTDKQVKIVKDGYEQMDAAQGDWLNGAKKAYANYADNASNIAGQVQGVFTDVFNGLADAFATFATTGKANFKDLATSIIADLIRIETRIAISKALQSMFGGGSTMSADQQSQLASGAGDFIDSVIASAKGNVFTSASLSAHSGTIVDKPTMFAFAKGAGLMGEAGPEAILPLQRGPDGKLGVTVSAATSAAKNGPVSINQNIIVQGRVDRRTTQQIATQSAREQRMAQTRNA